MILFNYKYNKKKKMIKKSNPENVISFYIKCYFEFFGKENIKYKLIKINKYN